jgi:hypothetical protein
VRALTTGVVKPVPAWVLHTSMSRLAPPLSERNETELERCDRHLGELMQELRVVQTGVQVLFGFLLTVPFTVRFEALGEGQRRIFFATLLMTGAAAMLLIAPSAQHRVLFRCGDKHHLVRLANRYALAGLACVALAITGALAFVADVVFGSSFAALAGAVAALACGWCWYGQPLLRRRSLHARASSSRSFRSSEASVAADVPAP